MPDQPHTSAAVGAFYGELFSAGFFTCEDAAPYLQEVSLQAIWNEQWLSAGPVCADGLPLRVVHPGIWNVEPGPDFRDATVQIGGELRRGAVEIHLHPEDWRRHGHDRDPAYRQVVLHVVWDNRHAYSSYPDGVPLLVLESQLARPLPDLLEQLDPSAYPYARKVPPGNLAALLGALHDRQVIDLLQAYGLARLLRKAQELGAEIERLGLEEAVYRRLLDAMGYKHNRRACLQVAAAVPLRDLEGGTRDDALALLFGAAGLLPDPSQDAILPEHRARVARFWRLWWPRRRGFEPIAWERAGLRPANTPERRLLAAALLLARHRWQLGQRLLDIGAADLGPLAAIKELRAAFALDDGDWRGFYSFAKTLGRPAALLGASRIDDLLVNLALPLYFARCLLENRPEGCAHGKAILLQMPCLQDNRLLEEAAHRFFVPPARAHAVVPNACAQQGLLKLYADLGRGG